MFTFLALLAANPSPAGLPCELPEFAVPAEFAEPGFDLASSPLATLTPEDVKPEEYGKWHGSLAAGATISDGNTERTTLNFSFKAENRREKDRRTGELLWNYAEEDDVLTERRTYGLLKYDYFFSPKFYGFGQLTGEANESADLDLRMILAGGVGYQYREDEKWKLAAEAGLAYIDEDYGDNSADGEFLAARLAHLADWKPNEKWVLGQMAEFYPSLEDSDDMSARIDTHAKLTLTEKLFAQAQWIYSWDNTPADGADHVDNLFLLAIGWSF